MKKSILLSILCVVAMAVMAQYPTRVYLCGPGTPSGWNTEQNPMYTYVDDNNVPTGMYEWVGALNDGQLKFLYGSSWEPAYIAVTDGEPFSIGEPHHFAERLTGSDPDNKWVATAGRYKIELNLIDSTITVFDGTGLADKNGNDQSFAVAIPSQIFPVGDGTSFGWNPGSSEAIDQVGETGVFDGIVLLKNGEFKLLHQQDWGAQYGPNTNGEIISGAGTYTLCKPSEDHKWVVDSVENLTAYHLIADVNAGTLVLRDTVFELPPLTTLYMCGDAVGGWDFETNAIELQSEDSVFHYEGMLSDGEFKFFEKKDFGSQAWGAAAAGTPVTGSGQFELVRLTEDNKFYMTAGNYKLTADLKNGLMTVEYEAPSAVENTQADRAEKVLINGKVVIIRNGEQYSVLGQKL